jgi:RNA polymerase sigma-70 factor (ECF subfamily)
MTGDLAEAHDLAQETLCRAWSNWDRLQAYELPEAWARRVLANLIIGRWRRRKTESRLGDRDLPDAATVPQIEVVAALNMLPKAQRQVIVLHDYVGLKVSEIAADVGVPVGTVKSWLSRGRAELAKELGLRTPSRTGGPSAGD